MAIQSQVPNSEIFCYTFLTSLPAATCTFLQSIFHSRPARAAAIIFKKCKPKCFYLEPFKGSLLHNEYNSSYPKNPIDHSASPTLLFNHLAH